MLVDSQVKEPQLHKSHLRHLLLYYPGPDPDSDELLGLANKNKFWPQVVLLVAVGPTHKNNWQPCSSTFNTNLLCNSFSSLFLFVMSRRWPEILIKYGKKSYLLILMTLKKKIFVHFTLHSQWSSLKLRSRIVNKFDLLLYNQISIADSLQSKLFVNPLWRHNFNNKPKLG